MEKIRDSPQIYDIFYFDLKFYFVYFLILELEKVDKKLLENNERERKWFVVTILTTKMVKLGVNKFYSMRKVRWWWIFLSPLIHLLRPHAPGLTFFKK